MGRKRQGAELTTKRRDKLDDSDFAFPEQRKEPLSDAAHVKAALARFDQTEGVSDAEKAEAKRRILKAAKKYGIQVDEGDDVKAASQPSVGQVHVNAPLKTVSVADDQDDKHKRASDGADDDDEEGDGIPDDEDPDDDGDDDKSDDSDEDDADERKKKAKKLDPTAGDDQDEGESEKAAESPTPEERPTRAFLTKMREHLSGKVSAEDLEAAIRHARAHAGGKGKAAKRKMAGEEVSDLCASGSGGYRLFLELRQASEAPAWIPFLPKPGTYTHQQWGKIAVTRERSQAFIDNFKDQVYQKHIPLDAEHQTKLSGAFAYLRDLRMNEDGSVDAKVEWTDRGKALVEAKQFRYFSPEWYDRWQEPRDGSWKQDIIIGGAFTTRPFFKDASLRPIVASERGLEAVEPDDSGEFVAVRYTADAPAPAGRKDNGMPPTTTERPAQASEQRTGVEDQSKRFAELEAKFAASEQARQAQETALKQATEQIAAMQATERRGRFTAEVLGKGEASGARWFGEPDKHVKLLEKLSDAFGEDSKEVRQYVEQNRAVAEAMRQSALFSEIGSDAAADADSPEAQADALAKKYQKQHAGVSYAQAYTEVVNQDPALQRRMVEQSRSARQKRDASA